MHGLRMFFGGLVTGAVLGLFVVPAPGRASPLGSETGSFSSFGAQPAAGATRAGASWADASSLGRVGGDPWTGRTFGLGASDTDRLSRLDHGSAWDRLVGKKDGRRYDSPTHAKVAKKLADLKVSRQEMARAGAMPAALQRMDARIDGFERLNDLFERRQTLVRAGKSGEQISSIDAKIARVRDLLRRLAVTPQAKAPDRAGGSRWQQGVGSGSPAPWRSFGSFAGESGPLRRSMGL